MKKRVKESNGGNLITNYTITYKNDIKGQKKKRWKKQTQGNQKDKDYHQSSREVQQISSHTQLMLSYKQQQKIPGKIQERVVEVCYQMLMIGPCDTTYFASSQRKLKQLSQLYTVQHVVKYIAENAKFYGARNMKNLQKLEDQEFWSKTMPKMIQYISDTKKQKIISAALPMNLPKTNQIIQLTKAQILMILINMFFCTLPKQSHRKNLNFAQLMYARQDEYQKLIAMKLQKLKCIVNYFKVMCRKKYKELQSAKVQIQRTHSNTSEIRQQLNTIQYRMADVDIREGLIQDRDGYDILVDFANKNIGGGVLTKGAVQQQILFCIYPQLLVTLCICYEMLDRQAIVVYNVDRINKYEGYSDTFKFAGNYSAQKEGPFTTTILAVDATDFRHIIEEERAQYTTHYVQRELHKMLIGIKAADYDSDPQMGICTGRWGCGVFRGDIYMKFLIQWIACSIANRKMVFMSQDKQQQTELQIMYKFLKKFDSLQILQIIEQYNHYFDPTDKSPQINFLQYVKKHSS